MNCLSTGAFALDDRFALLQNCPNVDLGLQSGGRAGSVYRQCHKYPHFRGAGGGNEQYQKAVPENF